MRKLKSLKPDLPFLGVVLFFVYGNMQWLLKDIVPPLWDQAAFLHSSEVLYHTLAGEGFMSFIGAFTETLKIKPPLMSVFPIPLYVLFGNEYDSALFVNLIFLVVSSFYMMRLGTLIAGRTEALVSVVILNTFPLVFAMSREFLAEFGLMTFVIMWMYYLLKSRTFEERKSVYILGILLGCGMLMKVSFIFYVLTPSLYLILKRTVKTKQNVALIFANVVRIVLIGSAVSAIWYLRNLSSVAEFSFSSGYGSLARHYAMGEIFSIKTIVGYWGNLINYGISSYYAVLLITFLIASMCIRMKGKVSLRLKTDSLWLMILWVIAPFLLFTFGGNKDYRYIIPFCPALALMTGIGLVQLVSKRILFIVLLLIFPLFQYINVSCALFPIQVHIKDFVLFGHHLGYAHPPVRDHWPNEQFVDYLNDDARRANNSRALVTLLFDHPYINVSNSAYFAAKKNMVIRFNTNEFYWNESLDMTLKRINEESDYLVAKSDKIGPEFVNVMNVKVAEKLNKGELPFLEIKTMSLPDETYITIFRKKHMHVYEGVESMNGIEMKNMQSVNFSNRIRLVGAKLQPKPQCYSLILFWECLDYMTENYKVFVHVYDSLQRPIYHADHYPHPKYMTSQWNMGEVILDEITLNTRFPETFHIRVGLYGESDGEKLPIEGKAADSTENVLGIEIY